jgi:hypothetical protein
MDEKLKKDNLMTKLKKNSNWSFFFKENKKNGAFCAFKN